MIHDENVQNVRGMKFKVLEQTHRDLQSLERLFLHQQGRHFPSEARHSCFVESPLANPCKQWPLPTRSVKLVQNAWGSPCQKSEQFMWGTQSRAAHGMYRPTQGKTSDVHPGVALRQQREHALNWQPGAAALLQRPQKRATLNDVAAIGPRQGRSTERMESLMAHAGPARGGRRGTVGSLGLPFASPKCGYRFPKMVAPRSAA